MCRYFDDLCGVVGMCSTEMQEFEVSTPVTNYIMVLVVSDTCTTLGILVWDQDYVT